MKMNKMLLVAGGMIGFSMLAMAPAHADSWFTKPNPYSYDKLIGNWYVDVTVDKEGTRTRVCGTERFLVNGTSRIEGEAIFYFPETPDNLGVVVAVTMNSSNKIELIGDKLVRTTMSVNNQLSELYFLHNEQIVEVPAEVRNQTIVDMRNVVASIDSVNQVDQGTINKLTATTMTETASDGETQVDAIKINRVIIECKQGD